VRELLGRKDVAEKVRAHYQNFDPHRLEGPWNSLDRGAYTHRIMHFELLTSQDEILARLTSAEAKGLMVEALRKLRSKEEYPEYFSIVHLEATALLIAKIIFLKGGGTISRQRLLETAGMAEFLSSGRFRDKGTLGSIVEGANMFVQGR
jgi:hypothetical protein